MIDCIRIKLIIIMKQCSSYSFFYHNNTSRLVSHCKKYAEFDPMLHSPESSNPWISGEETTWIIERSL